MEEKKNVEEVEALDYKHLDFPFIKKWLEENNEQAWFKKLWIDYTTEHNVKKPPFVVIKRAFCEKFMPDMLPKAPKSKSISMEDWFNTL